MKKSTLNFRITLFVLFIALIATTASLSAQKPFAGTIKFKMSIEGTDDVNLISEINRETDATYLGNKEKVVIVPQEGFSITIISDGDAKTSMMIYEITGLGKYYKMTSSEEIEKKRKNTKFDISYPGDKKTIAGYETKKAVVKMTDLETDEETEVVVYVSEELNPSDGANYANYPGLKGLVLRTEQPFDYDGTPTTIITEAIKLTPNKKIKDVDFMLPSDAKDYKEQPELRRLLDGEDSED